MPIMSEGLFFFRDNPIKGYIIMHDYVNLIEREKSIDARSKLYR